MQLDATVDGVLCSEDGGNGIDVELDLDNGH
jgi:hypothetical protein